MWESDKSDTCLMFPASLTLEANYSIDRPRYNKNFVLDNSFVAWAEQVCPLAVAALEFSNYVPRGVE